MGASVLAACIAGDFPFGSWLPVFNRGGYIEACATQQRDSYRVVTKGNATVVFTAMLHVDLEKMSLGSVFERVAHEDEIAAYGKVHETGQEAMSHEIG
jgi:hypothetical protein